MLKILLLLDFYKFYIIYKEFKNLSKVVHTRIFNINLPYAISTFSTNHRAKTLSHLLKSQLMVSFQV